MSKSLPQQVKPGRRSRMKGSQRREAKRRLIERCGAICAACGSSEGLTLDHIVPVALGGVNHLSNLQLLCEPCNHAKADRV